MSRAPAASSHGSEPEPADAKRRALLAGLAALAVAPRAAAASGALQRPAVVPLGAADAEALLMLDPDRIRRADVVGALARAPAPRIIALQGSLPLVTMEPLARLLIALGYPEEKLRHPRDGSLSQSSFGSSEELAGTLAWHYERDGIAPLLIGHSQGGMLAIRTLHELAGAFNDRVAVWNPVAGAAEPRAAIVDPRTGRERPVVGLTIPWATALATGKLPRLLLGQWSMLARLRQIPDTVDEFTGFALEWDPIAGNFGSVDPYVATGAARVRNVTLPVGCDHVRLPQVEEFAHHDAARGWIDAYRPGDGLPPPMTGVDSANLLHAAEIWHSVKRHWCREAQRLQRALAAREAAA